MKIIEIHAIPLSATWERVLGGAEKVPPELRRPAAHFQGVPRTGQFSTVVTVTAENGTKGIGEAWGLPVPGVTAMLINDLIAPLLRGRAVEEHAELWSMLADYMVRLGHSRGCMMEALSGIDLALWDLRARLAARPLNQLLGKPLRNRIEVYASPVLFEKTPEASARAAVAFCRRGFRGIKIKAGRGVDIDASHLSAIRREVGADISLMVDVNGGYDADTAIKLAGKIESLNIAWIEEPVPPEQLRAMSRVRKESPIPIAAGENEFSLQSFTNLLEQEAVDIVQPNVTRAGGITGTLQIAERAREYGVSVSLHGVGSGLMQCASLHAMSVLPDAGLFELNQFPNPLRESLVSPAPVFEDGSLMVPGGAGLGCELDHATLNRYRA